MVVSNDTKKRKEGSGVISLDPHLVKEYRLKFETFFDHRYVPRRVTHVNINQYLIPFLHALGFSHFYQGIRYIEITDDQFQTLDNVGQFVVYCKECEGKRFTNIEKRTISALSAAAILFTLGHDETERYLHIEREAIHQLGVDIDRIRVYGKEVFSLIMSRFDQYLTCSPIAPIYWSRIPTQRTHRRMERYYGLSESGRLSENPWIKRLRDTGLLD